MKHTKWGNGMVKVASLLFLALALSACSQAHVNIKSSPPSVTKTQSQLDDLQCANLSQYRGPWLFYYASKSEYKECLQNKGYTVSE